MSTDNLTSLFTLAVQGDQKAEAELLSYLGARFRLFVNRRLWAHDDREDIVQEALATVYLKYKEVESSEWFAGWAYQVLKNKLMNYQQSKSRREQLFTPLLPGADPADSGSYGQTIKRRLLNCLRQIWRLNIRYARILNLHYQGYSTEEICETLRLRPGTYYSVLSRAREKLRLCLEKGDLDQ